MNNQTKGIHEHEKLMSIWEKGKGKRGVIKLSCGCTAWCDKEGFPYRIDSPIIEDFGAEKEE